MANAALLKFIERVDELVETKDDFHVVANETAHHLSALLMHPEFLDEQHRQPAQDRYQQHVVHVHPEGKYSIVSLVWKPGQATPIHDHRCWCIVGVLQGTEQETRYHLVADRDEEWLTVTERSENEPGSICVLVPPDENIHKVGNGGDGVAISIHVYGADYGKVKTSINKVFDQAVRSDPSAGSEKIAWRDKVT